MVILLDSRLVKQMKKPKKKTIIKSSIFLFLIISILFLNFSTSDQIESTDFVFKLIHVATYDTPDAAVGVFVDNNIAYIADQHEDLQIINVTITVIVIILAGAWYYFYLENSQVRQDMV